jgi:FixJ family two-component response regulator
VSHRGCSAPRPSYGFASPDDAASCKRPAARACTLPNVPIVSIVDDDEPVRVALSNLIRSLGYEALAWSSAEELLASPRLRDTSCVITDVQMPGMNGLELQGKLAALLPRLPIIFITAFPDARLRQRAEQAGAIGFFDKPVSTRDLVDCLEAALKRS